MPKDRGECSSHLDRARQRVPNVQHAGHVGRRDHHHERRLVGLRVGLEEAAPLPPRVPGRFDGLGCVPDLKANSELSGKLRIFRCR